MKDVYLNQAGTSWPKPEPVREAVREALIAPVDSWAHRLDEQHETVCRAFGITQTDRLLLTPGATSALSAAILDHEWQPGDQLITSRFEHHAVVRPADLLTTRGVTVTAIPPGDGAALSVDELRAELGKGKTRLVAITAASNVTGDILPYEEVVQLAHEFGALCLIDASQTAGWIPIDVQALGVDLLAFTAHKALQGVWGVGGLYVAPTVAMFSPNAVCELPKSGEGRSCAPMPGYCDVGSIDRPALAGLVAGIEWLSEPENKDRLERARDQVRMFEARLRAFDSVVIHAHTDVVKRLPTIALTVEGRDLSALAAELAIAGVIASAGFQCAAQAHETLGTHASGVLRFSFGPGNGPGDAEWAVERLARVLA